MSQKLQKTFEINILSYSLPLTPDDIKKSKATKDENRYIEPSPPLIESIKNFEKNESPEFSKFKHSLSIYPTLMKEFREKYAIKRYEIPHCKCMAISGSNDSESAEEYEKHKAICDCDENEEMLVFLKFIEIAKFYNIMQIDDALAEQIFCAAEYPGTWMQSIKFIQMLNQLKDINIQGISAVTEENYKALDIYLNKSLWIKELITSERPFGGLNVAQTFNVLQANYTSGSDLYTCQTNEWQAILAGLIVLKEGGNLIIRQKIINKDLTALTALCFKSCYICKPLTSSPYVSETYLIALGFRKLETSDFVTPFINEPLTEFTIEPPDYISNKIEMIAKNLHKRQVQYIDEVSLLYTKLYKKQIKTHTYMDKAQQQFANNWLTNYMFGSNSFNKFQIPFNHHRQYYIQFGKPPEQEKFDRLINPDSPRLSYSSTAFLPKSTLHWGQLKLLLNEIEFFIIVLEDIKKKKLDPKQITMVYAGAASGIHQPILHKMFPTIRKILYDPRPFDKKLIDFAESSTQKMIEIHQEYFTDERAELYKNEEYLIFVCDIRTEDDSPIEFEAEVRQNMQMQKHWVEIMKPKWTQLKFRLPYDVKNNTPFEYFSGDIYIQPYPPLTSTETRLTFEDVPPLIKYDPLKYEEQCFYHNRVGRVLRYSQDFMKGQKIPSGFDECYDCTCHLYILNEYLVKIDTEKKWNLFSLMEMIRRDNYAS